MTASIERTMEFTAPIERVWQALADARELAAWFPNDGAHFEAKPGFEGWFRWQMKECTGQYAVRVEVAEPHQRLVWRWAREADTAIDKAYTTIVEWTLEPLANGGTRLHMVESGFEREQDRQENISGWQQELGELEALLAH